MPVDATIIPQKQNVPDFSAPMNILSLLQQTQNQQLQGQKLQQEVNQNTPALSSELTKTQIANAKLEGLAKQNAFWGQELGGLKSLGEKATYDDVSKALSRGLSLGHIDGNTALNYNKEIQSLKDKPEDLQKWVDQHYVATRSNEQQLQALMPKINYVDTGSGITITKQSPLTGHTEIQGIIPKNLSPAELSQTVEIKTPDGRTEVMTKGQLLNMVNQGGGTWNGVKPSSAPNGYTGRYPSAEAKSPVLGEHGGILSGAGTESGAAQSAAGTAQAGAVQSLANFASGVPNRVLSLEKAREILTEGTPTGPGTEWRNFARSFIGSLAPEMSEKIGGKDFNANTAKYEEFKKLMTNYANNVSGSLGSGTNDRLAAAITGNANPNIQNMANQDILSMTIASEKLAAAKNKAWQATGQDPSKFNKWESEFNSKKMLPESFVFESMTAPQQKAYLERLNKQGKLPEFKKAVTSYIRQGLIEVPQGQ